MEKPTPDKLNVEYWNTHPEHPARKLVDTLLGTRSDRVISFIDKYWWYELVNEEMKSLIEKAARIAEGHATFPNLKLGEIDRAIALADAVCGIIAKDIRTKLNAG